MPRFYGAFLLNSIKSNMARIAESELIINKDGSIYHLQVRPEDLADIVITVGDPDRVAKVSQYFDSIDVKIAKREFVTHTGYFKGKRLTVMSTGMGTDNIEILMNELDALVNIDLVKREPKANLKTLKIIRVGTSGSMQKEITVGSVLASTYGIGLDTLMAYYTIKLSDEEANAQDYIQAKLQLPFLPYCVQGSSHLLETVGKGMVKGSTVTCPGFYAPQGRKLRAELRFPDMLAALSKLAIGDIRPTNFEMETAGYYAMGRILGHEMLSVNAIIANRVSKEFAQNGEQIVDSMIREVLENIANNL